MPRVRRCRQPGCHVMVKLPDHYCAKHYAHEAEYLASRQKWTRSGDRTTTHKYNTVTRYRTYDKREQYQFYRGEQWQSLRQLVLDRDHYVCKYCGRPNSNTVDHIVPIEYDQQGTTDASNLATICRSCHYAKTQWEQSYYGTGQGNHLQDVQPIRSVDKIIPFLGRQRKR